MTAGPPADYYPPDLEEVPTALSLVPLGLATVEVANGGGKVVRIKPEGYELIKQASSRNAERMQRWRETHHSAPARALARA